MGDDTKKIYCQENFPDVSSLKKYLIFSIVKCKNDIRIYQRYNRISSSYLPKMPELAKLVNNKLFRVL